jgi:eukaryotic-like serine/threonine-protein kinase
MGQVFLAEDLKLQRRAALKLISPTLTRDETRRQRFVQEARVAASIDHPHIAAIYDIDEVDGRTYIAMEYVEGGSLREVLRAGPLKLRQALDYAGQAADALGKVHARGVVHRDLKPENLLIAKDGYLKIIDFGLAKLMDPVAHGALADAATVADVQVRTAEGVVMGTMGYMSPEQVRGETVDARSDIFSFGAVLYEMVSGVAAFRKRSAADTISAILGEMPAAPRVENLTAGTELQRVLRKCLAKDPDSRYQGMRDLVVDLRQLRESITSSETMSRQVEPARETATAWWRRRPVWIGAAVVAAAIAGAILWPVRRGSETPPAAPGGATARPAVAVVAFEVIGASSPDVTWLGKGLPSMLITGLAQTPDIEVVGNERLGDAARQIGASTLDGVERSKLAELARRAGARFILNGTIVQAGPDLRIDARVEDLSTGAVRVAETVRGPDALALADDLSARVRRGLDVKTAPGTVRKVADVASASVEAYRAFTAGVEARSNERNGDARELFKDAVRVDPEFALAYVHLAEVDRHEGRIRESSRWLRMAAQHLDRMPERDAVLVRADLARDAGRFDEADQLLEGLVARYPDTEQAWYNLAVSWWALDPARSVAFLGRAVAALPSSPGMRNLYGYAQLNTGRLEDAVRTFETYVKLRPSEPNALDSLAEAHLIAGHTPEALANYEAAIKGGFDSHRGKAWTLGVLGRYREALVEAEAASTNLGVATSTTRAFLLSRVGRYREALQAVDVSQKQAEDDGFTEAVVSSHVARALFALERRDCAGVAVHLGAADQVTKGMPALLAIRWQVLGDLLAGACDAGEGRLNVAKRRLAQARTVHRSTSLPEVWWVHALEGEVALAERDFDKAARAFAAGEPARKMFFNLGEIYAWVSFYANNLVLRDGRARAAAAQGRTAEAIALYRGLLTPGPGQKWTAMLDPRHVIALARLLDKAGQRDAARAEYQRFLQYWKAADPDLPELAEARARLAR